MSDAVRVKSGSFSFEIVDRPSETLDPEYKALLIAESCEIAKKAFRNDGVTDADVVKHAIDVSTAIFLRDSSDRLIGFSSTVVTQVNGRDIVYLEGTALHPDFQGRGLYGPVIALRTLLGLLAVGTSRSLVSTRISSPRILKTMVREFSLYPNPYVDTPEEFKELAEMFADIVRLNHSDFQGSTFDREHLVVRRAYARAATGEGFCMYDKDMPWCENDKHHTQDDRAMDEFVRQHLNYNDGDAFLMIGICDRDRVVDLLMKSAGAAGMDGSQLLDALRR
jgi:hypothetical protein